MDHDSTPKPSIDFDLLKLPQDFDNLLHAKKILTHVPLRKPHPFEWVRVHPTWQQSAAVLKLPGERRDDLFLLINELVPALPRDLVKGTTFVPTVSRQNTTFLWPLRMPASNGRPDIWATSAMEIAAFARTRWVQVHADLQSASYTYRTIDLDAEPAWPELPWPELRQLAFRDRVIDRLDHPILEMVLHGR